jgi:hypothetical protein
MGKRSSPAPDWKSLAPEISAQDIDRGNPLQLGEECLTGCRRARSNRTAFTGRYTQNEPEVRDRAACVKLDELTPPSQRGLI